jgi:predicted lipoprotein with Yx(FWY)xxD motif
MSAMPRLAFIGAAAATLALSGCGSATRQTISQAHTASQTAPQTATETATAATAVVARHDPRPSPPTVRVASTTYGRALIDTRGFALYLFTRDLTARSTCGGACAAAWPPYVVPKRRTVAARGLRASLLGVARRDDGRLQVTYAGHPLYYYVGDKRPGQVLCQAVTEFGGTWYVVAPDGRAIR